MIRHIIKESLAGLSMFLLLVLLICTGLRWDYVEAHTVDHQGRLVRPAAGIARFELPEVERVPDGVPADLWALFREYATEEVPAEVLAGVAKVESDFNPRCVTGVCYGLMQIHKRWEWDYLHGGAWDDPEVSIRACAEILTKHVRRYGSITRALMVYNEGNAGNREGTSRYSRKVMQYANNYKQ